LICEGGIAQGNPIPVIG